MKTILTFALFFVSVSAFAQKSTIKVNCLGISESGIKQIEALTNDSNEVLKVAIYATGYNPNPKFYGEYRVMESAAMWPIASLKAKRDDRLVDGALTEVSISIQDEAVVPDGKYPSTITITSTGWDWRVSKNVTTTEKYNASCSMDSVR